MLYSELLRVTVLLIAGVATVLGVLAVVLIHRDAATGPMVVGAVWWLAAAAIGFFLGRSRRSNEAVARVLAAARTTSTLPSASPARVALTRLWPILLFALVCGAAGALWPQVTAIAAGYAILIALAWRSRERAVQAIEDRDGVRFYVESSSPLEPLRLVRTPGLYRDRPPHRKAPPPPPLPG